LTLDPFTMALWELIVAGSLAGVLGGLFIFVTYCCNLELLLKLQALYHQYLFFVSPPKA